MAADSGRSGDETDDGLAAGLARAFGGALIFGLPMLMTMELWELGASANRLRLALLMLLSVPLLVGVAHRVGFEPTFGWREDLRDAGIALGVGMLAAAGILGLFNLLTPELSAAGLTGRIAIQAVPAALGALLARSQFGGERPDEDEDDDEGRALSGYGGTLFMMLVGALFLSLNIAPTEETVLISLTMTPWHAIGLVALTLAVMHAFVYARGVPDADAAPGWSNFLRFTLVGYVLALAISLGVLWTFGRTDALTPGAMLTATLVLGFPAGLGAAAARLIL